MIVSETILREIFLQLPPYKDGKNKEFQIRYEWGDQPDLLLFLKTIAGNKYPLIWLVNGEQIVDRYANSIRRKCRLILSKDSKHVENRNPTVWDTEFVNCLNPLLENVLKCIEQSGVIEITNTHVERREANYTEENLTKAIDFWNVIILDIELKFNNGCINKNIKF